MDPLTFTLVFEHVDGGWIQARLAELPAVITAAPTREEAREMLLDALREYLLANAADLPEGTDVEVEELRVLLESA